MHSRHCKAVHVAGLAAKPSAIRHALYSVRINMDDLWCGKNIGG